MPLQPPPDLDRDLFVYGTLKPSELGHHQIESVVEEFRMATVPEFRLTIRDGLPLLVRGDGEVEGVLVRFRDSVEGYGRVCKFEPAQQYEWVDRGVTVELADGARVRANALRGRLADKGTTNPADHRKWSSAEDAVFVEGLHTASRMIKEISPSHPEDPEPFFRAQAAYLLLFTAVERAAALLFGPDLLPTKRVKRIRWLPCWDAWVEAAEIRLDRRELLDSRNPASTVRLIDDPWRYWYMVRSNLTHRGKSALRDFDLVRDSFIDVHDLLRLVLGHHAPAVRTGWTRLEPDGESHEWRLRPVLVP